MNKAVPTLILLILVAAVGGGVTYYFMKSNEEVVTPENRLPREESEFRAKIAEFRMQKEKLQRGLARFEKQKKDTLDQLRKKGIKSSADVDPNDNDVQYALRNLREISTQMEKLREDVSSYDQAIEGLNQMLVKIETRNIQDAAAISEEEVFELRKIVIDLNERLMPDTNDIFESEELNKLLDAELKADESK